MTPRKGLRTIEKKLSLTSSFSEYCKSSSRVHPVKIELRGQVFSTLSSDWVPEPTKKRTQWLRGPLFYLNHGDPLVSFYIRLVIIFVSLILSLHRYLQFFCL